MATEQPSDVKDANEDTDSQDKAEYEAFMDLEELTGMEQVIAVHGDHTFQVW